VPQDTLTFLQNNDAALKEVLLYHVVARLTLYSVGMRHAMSFPTADRHHDRIMLLESGTGDVYLNDVHVSEVDISATNGVIHVLDGVLIPTSVVLMMESAGLTLG